MATYEATRYSITGANITTNTIPAPSVVDGTVSNANFERINTVSSNVQTQIDAKVATTGATITGDFDFEDDAKARFGDGNDLEIYDSDPVKVTQPGGADTNLICTAPTGTIGTGASTDQSQEVITRNQIKHLKSLHLKKYK